MRSSDAAPPSGSASNNDIVAGAVGFLMALVVVIPLIIVCVLLHLLYTRRIVMGRRAHNQTENATGTVEEYSMREIVSLINFYVQLCEFSTYFSYINFTQ